MDEAFPLEDSLREAQTRLPPFPTEEELSKLNHFMQQTQAQVCSKSNASP